MYMHKAVCNNMHAWKQHTKGRGSRYYRPDYQACTFASRLKVHFAIKMSFNSHD